MAEFRGHTDRERAGYLLVLEWFENFRLRHELSAGREAATRFWKEEVRREDRPREPWQLEQWGQAIQWYLKWLEACAAAGGDHRSLPERVRGAVYSACSRRGLALRTKQCYGAWGARYAVFAGADSEVMKVDSAEGRGSGCNFQISILILPKGASQTSIFRMTEDVHSTSQSPHKSTIIIHQSSILLADVIIGPVPSDTTPLGLMGCRAFSPG